MRLTFLFSLLVSAVFFENLVQQGTQLTTNFGVQLREQLKVASSCFLETIVTLRAYVRSLIVKLREKISSLYRKEEIPKKEDDENSPEKLEAFFKDFIAQLQKMKESADQKEDLASENEKSSQEHHETHESVEENEKEIKDEVDGKKDNEKQVL